MERTKVAKVVKQDDQINWINRGGTFHMRDGRVIKNGETFKASLEAIPDAFRDIIKPVDPFTVVQPVIQPIKPGFHLQQRKSTEFFDILDGNGKRLNEKDLTEQEAKNILDKFI